MKKAIIGGTGVYNIDKEAYTKTVDTRYGKAEVSIANLDGEEIIFLARHGTDHSIPPHLINYRANMMALKELGVKYIYASAAVGSCNEEYAPGDIVVIKDFLDFTKLRPVTFFEGGKEPVVHVGMEDPYCRNLRAKFYEAANSESIHIKGDAVYVCTEGPRFETAAEIQMYRKMDGDVVGMTSVPEVVLARELGLCYSTIGIITNWCTGLEETMTTDNMGELLNLNKERITRILLKIFKGGLDQKNCSCNDSIIKL